jgi:hypothetical protein
MILIGSGLHALIVEQGFYDSAKDRLIEPSHTGISYSFTDDGHYEVSYYRAIANRMLRYFSLFE